MAKSKARALSKYQGWQPSPEDMRKAAQSTAATLVKDVKDAKASQAPKVIVVSQPQKPQHYQSNNNRAAVPPDVSNKLKTASSGSAAALAAVLPGQYATRYQAGYANTRTSVATPFVVESVDFSVMPGDTAELGAGCMFAAVSRDPLNAIILYVPNPNAYEGTYRAHFSTQATPGDEPVVMDRLYVLPQPDYEQWLTFEKFVDSNIGNPLKIHPHGSVMYARSPETQQDMKFVYMTKNEQIQINIGDSGTLPVTTPFSWTMYKWNGTRPEPMQTNVVSVTYTDVWSAPESGNYAFSFRFTGTVLSSAVTVKLWWTVNNPAHNHYNVHSHLGHMPIPGLSERSLMSAIRVNGCSLMITPDSTTLASGGRIAGSQTDDSFLVESLVRNVAGGQATDTVENLDESVTMDYHKGGYAFHKPRSSKSYDRVVPIKHNSDYQPRSVDGSSSISQTVSGYYSNLTAPDGWVVYAINTPQAPVGVFADNWPGGIAHLSFCFSVEYWHNDVWIMKELPPLGTADYASVMQLIGTADQFHSNAMHLSDLKNWYNKASPYVRKIAPSLLRLVKMLHPGAAGMAGVIEALGQALPNKI
jgi:hypothetical protein